MINWILVKKQLGELIPYDKNPRKRTDEGWQQLELSISEIGLASVPNITQDNVILSGHQRIAMLIEKHGKAHEINCFMADRALNEHEMMDVVIWLNKAIAGEWDRVFIEKNFQTLNFEKYHFDKKEKKERTPNKFCPKCGHSF